MSADNGLIISKVKGKYKVIYYQGDSKIKVWECKTLKVAVKKAREVDDEFHGTEYGISISGNV